MRKIIICLTAILALLFLAPATPAEAITLTGHLGEDGNYRTEDGFLFGSETETWYSMDVYVAFTDPALQNSTGDVVFYISKNGEKDTVINAFKHEAGHAADHYKISFPYGWRKCLPSDYEIIDEKIGGKTKAVIYPNSLFAGSIGDLSISATFGTGAVLHLGDRLCIEPLYGRPEMLPNAYFGKEAPKNVLAIDVNMQQATLDQRKQAFSENDTILSTSEPVDESDEMSEYLPGTARYIYNWLAQMMSGDEHILEWDETPGAKLAEAGAKLAELVAAGSLKGLNIQNIRPCLVVRKDGAGTALLAGLVVPDDNGDFTLLFNPYDVTAKYKINLTAKNGGGECKELVGLVGEKSDALGMINYVLSACAEYQKSHKAVKPYDFPGKCVSGEAFYYIESDKCEAAVKSYITDRLNKNAFPGALTDAKLPTDTVLVVYDNGVSKSAYISPMRSGMTLDNPVDQETTPAPFPLNVTPTPNPEGGKTAKVTPTPAAGHEEPAQISPLPTTEPRGDIGKTVDMTPIIICAALIGVAIVSFVVAKIIKAKREENL